MRSAVIVAAGESERFLKNKMTAKLWGKPLICVTVEKFLEIADEIIVVAHPSQTELLGGLLDENCKIVAGGATRSLSVINGLNAVSEKSQCVAIHDGARPYVSGELIERAFAEAESQNSAVPIIKMTDSLYRQDFDGVSPVDREKLCRVQTPQVFKTDMIKQAYQNRDMTKIYSDDSQVFFDCFGNVHFFAGEPVNKKVTYPSDLPDYRIGNGWDVHQLAAGRDLFLGGVKIPFEKGLLGHSDADVLLHAIMDSLLSAANLGDIGTHFPDTDEQYKGISSITLLQQVNGMLKQSGALVQNISCVVIAEAPKLAPHIPAMQKTIADALQISPSQISISATTAEKLGIIGEGNGIAAEAAALILFRPID